MPEIKLICPELPDMPWQDKPENCTSPMWRYSANPITKRNPTPNTARIFNSAVIPYGNGFVGVFRGEQRDGVPHIYFGTSSDAINWSFNSEKIKFVDENGEPFQPVYAYDPRLVRIDDTYYIMWCQDMYGATIGMAKTTDFRTFTRIENPFLPYNRNAVLFPRKINGNFVILSRPCDAGHTAFGDIFISESPDMQYWGKHRHVMGTKNSNWWENLKVGGGAVPIETDKGWLMFYHGVVNTCNGYVYSIGACILDINEPSKVLHRCADYVLTPEEDYEVNGFVPNVCFPCATLHDAKTGRIALYYGCADTYIGIAFTTADEIYSYILAHDCADNDDKSSGRR